VKSAHPVVHRFEIEKETRTWILVLVGVLGLGGAGAAGAAIQGSSKNSVDPVEKKQLETLIENNDRKRRECDQKRHEWQKKQDKLFRATIRKLGGGIQGPSYPDVEFHPPPAPGSDAPKWQTTETLLEPPSCE
jgi:uncharacterized protein HemX